MYAGHRKSNRLQHYDYSRPGYYFVTICTHNRQCLFGDIVEGRMIVNEVGTIIVRWWKETKNKFPNIELDEFAIMPNHIHGIIAIVGADLRVCPDATGQGTTDRGIKQGEHAGSPLQTIIQWFKTMTTNEYIQGVKSGICPPFKKRLWQRSFYDHVIRGESSLHDVREYIHHNPLNWASDENNPARGLKPKPATGHCP